MFDGSSIYGFARVEESDMVLKPDLKSLKIFPWEEDGFKTASIMCDIYTTEGRHIKGVLESVLRGLLRRQKREVIQCM